ncbi:class I SAM-dependent methyltransferase [Flexithrix dorotheae]|uniref:class I SAM-dependent methyltransferase n=1 Tax=Flexithrix dorotheae TaxID=70993 RepID=UPI0005C4E79F|nr:class I SAM-dependent methyltransferase [Flexithrix dorotheae]
MENQILYCLQDINNKLLNTLYALDNLRRNMREDEWRNFCQNETTKYNLHTQLLKDPYTKRAFEKPRGYAGDAIMMDFLYGVLPPPDVESNPVGRSVFDFTTQSDPGKAVVFRKKYIAGLIDQKAQDSNVPVSVLSLAAGHLRETEMMKSFLQKKIKRFIAFDQDEKSLAKINREGIHSCVKTCPGKIKDLIEGNIDLGKFDFIYASGLFDYLPEKPAKKLIQWMFSSLNPGGTLLVPNFRAQLPNSIFRTYMEAFMNWFLIYREDEEIIGLFEKIQPTAIDKLSYFNDPVCNIGYVLVSKRA